jgi:ABC-2 type transport system permease protein
MAWRSFVFTLVINQAAMPLIGLAVWTAALPGQPRLSTYFVALLFVQLMTVSQENETLSYSITSGELSDSLLRPHPVVLATIGENVALRLWHLIVSLPLLIGVALLTHLPIRGSQIVLALPALLGAATLRFLFTYTLALTAFWTGGANSIVSFGSSLVFLLGGGAAPIALLPSSLRAWGEAMPFCAMSGLPAEIASGSLQGSALQRGCLWQGGWLLVFLWLSVALWRAGIRRYTAAGG